MEVRTSARSTVLWRCMYTSILLEIARCALRSTQQILLVRFLGHLFEHAQAIGVGEQRIPLPICLDHLLDAHCQRCLLSLGSLRGEIEGFPRFVNHVDISF